MKKLVRLLSYILSTSLIVFLLPINQVNAAPTFIYEWLSQSGTISADGLAHEYTNLEAGQSIDLSLTLINRSGITIVGKSNLSSSPDKQVPIGVWGIGSQTPYQDGTPSFLDLSSFVLNNNRFVYYDGPNVPDNGLLTMSWTIKLASNLSDGVYNLYVRPVSEYLAWTRQIKSGRLLPTTSSDIFWRLTVGSRGYYLPTDWITYTNEEHGFQVNIPSEYQYEEYSTYGEEIYSAGFIISDEPYSDNVFIYIAPCNYASDVDCLNSLYNGLSSSSPEFEYYLTISGKKASYYDSTKTAGSYVYYVVSDEESKFVIKGNRGSIVLEGMVDSFRFI